LPVNYSLVDLCIFKGFYERQEVLHHVPSNVTSMG
jgi:hypothetical protein